MLALLNAIYWKFGSSSSLAVMFPGGMHRDVAPASTPMPYVISHVVSSSVAFSYGGQTRTVVNLRFSIMGIEHDASCALAEAFVAVFDVGLLTMSPGTNDSVVRQGDLTPTLHPPDSQGNDVWEWAVVYEFGIVSGD